MTIFYSHNKSPATKVLLHMTAVAVASGKGVRLRSHFLEFTDARFHYWVLNMTLNEKNPEWLKWTVNHWYEVYTRFYKA